MAVAHREPVPNAALYNARDARGETQEQTAEALNKLARQRGEKNTAITGNQISRWERGIVHPSRLHCQLLAAHFGMNLAELGLTRQRAVPANPIDGADDAADMLLIEDATPTEAEQRVIDSQQEWLRVRKTLHANHLRLAQTAAQLYPEDASNRAAGLLVRPDWMWEHPIGLDAVRITYDGNQPLPAITGTEDASSQVRPTFGRGPVPAVQPCHPRLGTADLV